MKKLSIVFLAIFLFSLQAQAMKRQVRGFGSCFTRLGWRNAKTLFLRNNMWRLRKGVVGRNSLHTSSAVAIMSQNRRYYVVEHSKQKDVLDFDDKKFDELIAKKLQIMTQQEKYKFSEVLKALQNNSLAPHDAVPLITDLVFQLIKPEQLAPEAQETLKQLIAQHVDAALNEIENIYDWSQDHIKKRTLLGRGIVYSVAGLTALNVVISFGVLVLAVVYACYPDLLGEKKEQG